jgi:hypothetical protein
MIRRSFHCFFLSPRVLNPNKKISPIKVLSNEIDFAESGFNDASSLTNAAGCSTPTNGK